MAREAWTDERLDDLNHRVDTGFSEVRADLREIRAEMAASRRTFAQVAGAIWVTSMIGFLSVIATILTQV